MRTKQDVIQEFGCKENTVNYRVSKTCLIWIPQAELLLREKGIEGDKTQMHLSTQEDVAVNI